MATCPRVFRCPCCPPGRYHTCSCLLALSSNKDLYKAGVLLKCRPAKDLHWCMHPVNCMLQTVSALFDRCNAGTHLSVSTSQGVFCIMPGGSVTSALACLKWSLQSYDSKHTLLWCAGADGVEPTMRRRALENSSNSAISPSATSAALPPQQAGSANTQMRTQASQAAQQAFGNDTASAANSSTTDSQIARASRGPSFRPSTTGGGSRSGGSNYRPPAVPVKTPAPNRGGRSNSPSRNSDGSPDSGSDGGSPDSGSDSGSSDSGGGSGSSDSGGGSSGASSGTGCCCYDHGKNPNTATCTVANDPNYCIGSYQCA